MGSFTSILAPASRWLGVPVLVPTLALVLTSSPASGQDALPGTPSDPPTLKIPEALESDQPPREDRPPGEDRRAREKIREMIEGGDTPAETGDPILDGVLDLLRSQGSLLDGSSLDPRSDRAPAVDGAPQPLPRIIPLPADEARPGDRRPGDRRPGDRRPGDRRPGDRQPGDRRPGAWEGPFREDGQFLPQPTLDAELGSGSLGPAADGEDRFLLAEQLLKTARLLAARPSGDAARRRLVEDLRSEAARCLLPERLVPERLSPPGYGPTPAAHTESY